MAVQGSGGRSGAPRRPLNSSDTYRSHGGYYKHNYNGSREWVPVEEDRCSSQNSSSDVNYYPKWSFFTWFFIAFFMFLGSAVLIETATNFERHINDGMTPKEAIFRSVSEAMLQDNIVAPDATETPIKTEPKTIQSKQPIDNISVKYINNSVTPLKIMFAVDETTNEIYNNISTEYYEDENGDLHFTKVIAINKNGLEITFEK
jgi:hypothetical protein